MGRATGVGSGVVSLGATTSGGSPTRGASVAAFVGWVVDPLAVADGRVVALTAVFSNTMSLPVPASAPAVTVHAKPTKAIRANARFTHVPTRLAALRYGCAVGDWSRVVRLSA